MRALRAGVLLLILTFAQCASSDAVFVRRAERARTMPGGGSAADGVAPTIFDQAANSNGQGNGQGNGPRNTPREERLQRAGSFDGDLRSLPDRPVRKRERPEREGPAPAPIELPNPNVAAPVQQADTTQALNAPAPGPSASFEGLDFATWGAGHPPDTNGDVGPTYYIQTVNTSIGVYDKTTGTRVAAFTFDTFMSQGNFGNVCDSDNFGDPVVLYDTFEDRWVISDFAFILDPSGNVINPPGSYQCFAVSKTGDPVSGGWNYYSINTTGGLGDYPKLGVWPDGIYMSVNMFDYAAAGSFQNVRLYALNKTQMYAGASNVQIVSFDVPATEFTLLPANARLQTGTPPPGSPNYFASVWNYLNVVGIWTFHVDWNSLSASSLTGPFNAITATSWSQLTSGTVPSPGNRLDTLYPRLMVQNQYSNIGGVESLWNAHTVGASGASSSQSAVRYYETRVTGGTIASNTTQAFTYSPDTTNRFMPSVAVDRAGNLAIGYSATSSSVYPALRYAGRLAGDAVNTITQTETTMLAGTGTQTGNCGGSTCVRWGDYSAMTLDPNGCTFWYTNEYYQVSGLNDRTRIGAFNFASCSGVSVGSLQGTVTTSGSPLAGATIALGSRTATTDANGNYSFADLPAGTYPSVTASKAGFTSITFTSIAINSGVTTTRNFDLTAAPQVGCFTDTAQADFQSGTSSNCDPITTPGSLILSKPSNIDQQNLSVTSSGFAFNTTSWAGQTFTPAVTGALTRIDLDLFCSGCTGTTPNIAVSIRATAGSPPVPTGSDLASTTIAGFSSGAGGMFSAVFASPVTLTAGVRYAVIMRPVSPPSAGTYAYVCSCGNGNTGTNPYANGQRVVSSNSGGSWTADTAQGGRDLGFITYMHSGFASSGNFISSTKDANPAAGKMAAWGTIGWNATVPAGTTLQIQAAASDSVYGPFNFVGPDGTAGTYFTNGASLDRFNNHRYLQYKVVMTTTNSGVTPTLSDVTLCFKNAVDDATVTAAVIAGDTRLQQLQNPDGGWYYLVGDPDCGAGTGVSCRNTIGITALALLSEYDRNHDASVLADAVQAGQLLKSIHDANPSRQPVVQDLEFLVALSTASGDAQYSTLATTWFQTVTAIDPDPATRAAWNFSVRANKAVAVWDIASLIRMAKAAGNVPYASGLASYVVAHEADWNNGTGSVLLAMGSMLWAIHDLSGFDTQIAAYRSWLLSHQDAAGSWDGDLQTTSYVVMGLGAVGGGTSASLTAVEFFIANQLANGGFPFVAGGTSEYAEVDAEVIRAMDRLYNTQTGQGVQAFGASQLATVTFTDVSVSGSTTVVASHATGSLPFGYALMPGTNYQIGTSAATAGSTTVCFSTALMPGTNAARILHLENGVFVDRTSSPNCATVDALDTFAISRIDPNAIDSEAPTLTVSLSPSTIAQANNKMIAITATIATHDNADASPTITLVSVTSSVDGPGNKNDVQDAAIGTDDREFSVRAVKGAIYTVVYRATDRSGNTTTTNVRTYVQR